MAKELYGKYFVKPIPSAIRDAKELLPSHLDYRELKRQALKLAFFPDGETDDGTVEDLNWERLKGTGNRDIAELRISDKIGGCDNLRIIFLVADTILPGDEMPRIWILSVLQKKTKRFTPFDHRTFKGRAKIVKTRHYDGR